MARTRKWDVRTDGQTYGRTLVGCFGFNGPLRQYFSLYRVVSQREGERGERIDESKNVQTTPTRTYCKRNRPLPYCSQKCRTPLHWKFTQHHRTTRPPPKDGRTGRTGVTLNVLPLFFEYAGHNKYGIFGALHIRQSLYVAKLTSKRRLNR